MLYIIVNIFIKRVKKGFPVEEFDEFSRILRLISNPRRRRLLQELQGESIASLRMLSECSDIPVQETHKLLTDLLRLGVVKKEERGEYALTSFGRLLSVYLKNLQCLTELRDYLSKHAFPKIPEGLITLVIQSLSSSKVIRNVYEIYDQIIRIIESSKRIYLMSRNVHKFVGNKSFKRELKGKVIVVGKSLINCMIVNSKLSTFPKIHVRCLYKNLKFLPELVVGDENAVISLTDIHGNIDFNNALLFYGKPSTINIKQIFNYYWAKSEDVC